MSTLREALEDEFGGTLAAKAAERVFRDHWQEHRDAMLTAVARAQHDWPYSELAVNAMERVLFGAPQAPLDQEQPMTTYFIREHSSGRIVNAVETSSLDRATAVCERMVGDLYPDPNPPRAVLEAYRYWNERP